MVSPDLLGYGLAVLSLVFSGSFSSLAKFPTVIKSNVSATIFNLYFLIGTYIQLHCNINLF